MTSSPYFVAPADNQNGESPARCGILFIVGQLGGGGLEQQICYLLKQMDRKRYRPGIAVWNYRESDVYVAKIKALNIPLWGYPLAMSSVRKLYELMTLARQLSPEVIHSYTFFTNFAAYGAAQAAGSVAIGSVRNELDLDLVHQKPILGRMSAALPRFQISNSNAAAEKAMRPEKHFKPKHMNVVLNGLDMDRFRQTALPLHPPHRILGIGSLATSKRWDRMILLSKGLKLRGVNCLVQIAGQGPLRSQLEALAATHDVAEQTQFLGFREDISELIAGARVVVHTSDGEGSPNAVMEALAAGRPAVATDVGDVARIIENGKTGFVVSREDPDALLARVMEILQDDALAQRMADNALEYARREFGLARLVRDTFSAYRAAGWKSDIGAQ